MKRFYSAIFVFFLCTSLAIAQETTPHKDSWTLRECILRARSESLDVRQARLGTHSVKIQNTQAHHSRFPSLNLNGSYGYNFGRTIDPTSNDFISTNLGFNSWGASVNLPLFGGGRIHNSIKQSSYELSAAYANEKSIKRQVTISVARAFLQILMAEEQVRSAEYQLRLSEKQLKRVKEFIASGVKAENASLNFKAQVSRSKENLINAQNTLTTAELDLLQLLHLNISLEDFSVQVPDLSHKEWATEQIPTIGELLPRALKIDPRIKSDSLTMLADRYGIKVAKGAFYPSLGISGSLSTNYSTEGINLLGVKNTTQDIIVQINGQPVTVGFPSQEPIYEKASYLDQLNNNFGYGFFLSLSIPIYNNYRNKAAVEQAKVNYLQSETQLERSRWQVRSEVQQIILNAQAAQQSYIAQKNTLNSLKAAYENAQLRYELGAINNFDLLSAQNEYNQAQQNLISAKYNLIFQLKVIDFYQGKLLTIQ